MLIAILIAIKAAWWQHSLLCIRILGDLWKLLVL